VTATFSEAVQGVSATTFTLRNATTGAAVAAAVNYNGTSRIATLNPKSNLAAGTPYEATLTGGAGAIRDAAGNALDTTTWTFTTTGGSSSAPTVKTRTPAVDATAVGLAANVTATFSEAVTGVDAGTFTLRNRDTGAAVQAAVTRNGTTNQWILNPNASLTKDTWYTVTLTGGPTAIRDTGGAPLSTVTWNFLTGPAPTVKTRVPAANATGVNPATQVLATFSEEVQDVDATTFTLKNAATGAMISGVVTRDGTTNRWILDPNGTLEPRTKYTVTVLGKTTGVRDVAGNPLKATATWSFTTS
jgi:hypothetical protein